MSREMNRDSAGRDAVLSASSPAAPGAATSAGAPLEVCGLCYAYPDGHRALNGVSFTLGRGEKLALVGPNGSGKSTLMLHLAGCIAAQTGTVSLEGVPVGKDLKRLREAVGLIFQDPDDQLFMPQVVEDVAFGPVAHGVPAEEAHARAREVLEFLNVGHLAEWSPDPVKYVCNALAPAQVNMVEVDDEHKTLLVVVPDDQLSLAIGRQGQNVRLAYRLLGWRIDVKSQQRYTNLENPGYRSLLLVQGIDENLADRLFAGGILTAAMLAESDTNELVRLLKADEAVVRVVQERAREVASPVLSGAEAAGSAASGAEALAGQTEVENDRPDAEQPGSAATGA